MDKKELSKAIAKEMLKNFDELFIEAVDACCSDKNINMPEIFGLVLEQLHKELRAIGYYDVFPE